MVSYVKWPYLTGNIIFSFCSSGSARRRTAAHGVRWARCTTTSTSGYKLTSATSLWSHMSRRKEDSAMDRYWGKRLLSCKTCRSEQRTDSAPDQLEGLIEGVHAWSECVTPSIWRREQLKSAKLLFCIFETKRHRSNMLRLNLIVPEFQSKDIETKSWFCCENQHQK